jgi:NAD(P)H dehydrogenase (quinone)
MYILVLYYSRGGKTKLLAESIAGGVEEIDGVECVLKSATEVSREEFAGADGVIAGSPVYFGTMASELKAVFDKFVSVRREMENKVGAAFTTSGDLSGGKETTILSIVQAMFIYGMIVVGDPMSATGHYGVSCTGMPDGDTLENGKKLGRRVASLVRSLQTDE